MQCLLVGNYGDGNVGDEALKEYFLRRFPEVEWTVVSARPSEGEVPRLPAGIRSLLGFRWVRTLRHMRRVEAVVFGGGTLFTDIESPLACLLWWVHVLGARLMGKPVALAFQGVGPFRTRRGRGWARSALRMTDFLSVRDADSAERIPELLKNKNCVRTADPIFLYNQNIESRNTKKVFIVIPRRNSDLHFERRFATLSKEGSYDEIRLLSLQPDDATEKATITRLTFLSTARPIVVAIHSLEQLQQEVAGASNVLTQRYHGAIAALLQGVPTEICIQQAGDKLSALRDAVAGGTVAAHLEESRRLALAGEDALRGWLASLRA